MTTTLVKNGTVVTASDRYDADIYIDKGVITLIGQGLSMPADTVVDASGKLVMPGGIDVHTHLDMPLGDTVSADDFESGTIALKDVKKDKLKHTLPTKPKKKKRTTIASE